MGVQPSSSFSTELASVVLCSFLTSLSPGYHADRVLPAVCDARPTTYDSLLDTRRTSTSYELPLAARECFCKFVQSVLHRRVCGHAPTTPPRPEAGATRGEA